MLSAHDSRGLAACTSQERRVVVICNLERLIVDSSARRSRVASLKVDIPTIIDSQDVRTLLLVI